MSAAALRARYLGDTVATASPQQLLVMLYDRLALDLERAQKAVAAGSKEAAREQLQHASDIVLELLQAQLKMDSNRISSCRQVVEPLRDAWRQAAASLAGPL